MTEPEPETAPATPSPQIIAALADRHRVFLDFLERRVGSRVVAEDLLQDAFVRGMERGGQIRDEESAVAWFYRSLRNALTDHWRRRGAEKRALERLEAQPVEPAIDEDGLRDDACRCVLSLLDLLKPEHAAALRRVDVEETSVRDYAREAGITANNASVRLFRAREALRREVTRCCGTCAEHGCVDCTCKGPAPRA